MVAAIPGVHMAPTAMVAAGTRHCEMVELFVDCVVVFVEVVAAIPSGELQLGSH